MTSDTTTLTPAPGTPAEIAIPMLVDREGGRLFSVAMRMCGNAHQAEDLVQEVFLQAYRKWDQFEGRSSPGTWLYTIATRLCYRRLRRRSGQPNRIQSLEELLPFGNGQVPDVPAESETPLAHQIRTEAREEIESAITTLPANFRLPLILKDIIGLSVLEVAQTLGLKEATVKTRLHRARLVLRRAMDEVVPSRDAPPAAYSKRVCMDLLRAKQESLDNGTEFPVPQGEFCSRCRAVFDSLDLSSTLCEELSVGAMPAGLRELVLQDLRDEPPRPRKRGRAYSG